VGAQGAEDAAAIEKAHGNFMDYAVFPGYSMKENLPLNGDHLEAVVRWKTRAEVRDWAGKSVRLTAEPNWRQASVGSVDSIQARPPPSLQSTNKIYWRA